MTPGIRTRACLRSHGFQVIENSGQGDCLIESLLDACLHLRSNDASLLIPGMELPDLTNQRDTRRRTQWRKKFREILVDKLRELASSPGNPFGDMQFDDKLGPDAILSSIVDADEAEHDAANDAVWRQTREQIHRHSVSWAAKNRRDIPNSDDRWNGFLDTMRTQFVHLDGQVFLPVAAALLSRPIIIHTCGFSSSTNTFSYQKTSQPNSDDLQRDWGIPPDAEPLEITYYIEAQASHYMHVRQQRMADPDLDPPGDVVTLSDDNSYPRRISSAKRPCKHTQPDRNLPHPPRLDDQPTYRSGIRPQHFSNQSHCEMPSSSHPPCGTPTPPSGDNPITPPHHAETRPP